jgi:hypothetical protein
LHHRGARRTAGRHHPGGHEHDQRQGAKAHASLTISGSLHGSRQDIPQTPTKRP